jgi:hypothetical protein
MTRSLVWSAILFVGLAPAVAQAQSVTNLAAIHGLAPLEALPNTYGGRAALGANFTMTRAIQTGTSGQPTLLPFPEQQQQALRDAFITKGNLAELADGLGTTLGAAYEARAHYISHDRFTSLSPGLRNLIAYALGVTHADADAGKYFFANGTTNGKDAASDAATGILKDMNAKPDIFGRAYGHPAGSPGADHYGNSRPFQTIAGLLTITGRDYFGTAADNIVYNQGPIMDLVNSPSFPSGHTTYAFTGALLLAMLVPERYQALMTRAAEYGNDRIILGAHYAMDVIAGRTLATYDMAHLLANDPAYTGLTIKGSSTVKDFQAAVSAARGDATTILEASCGDTIPICAAADHGRFSNLADDGAFYASTLTYGLPVVFHKNASGEENVARMAPEAGYLLTVAFPTVSLAQADQILTETEAPGGGFLDNGTPFGVYSRLDLFRAAGRAEALVAAKTPDKTNTQAHTAPAQ